MKVTQLKKAEAELEAAGGEFHRRRTETRLEQREKYTGNPLRVAADFSAETLGGSGRYMQNARRKKEGQPGTLNLAHLSFRIGEKCFPDKQQLKFIDTNWPYEKCYRDFFGKKKKVQIINHSGKYTVKVVT